VKSVKINPFSAQKAANLYRSFENQVKKDNLPVEKNTQADQVILSPEAASLQAALKASKGGEDVREAKVQAIQQQIKNGTYRIDSRQVAAKIIDQVLLDKKI